MWTATKPKTEIALSKEKSGLLFFTIREYHPCWAEIAKLEMEAITAKLSSFEGFKEIQHVGSTSIPGMAAKPMLDLFIGVDTEESNNKVFEVLALLGFTSHQQDGFWSKAVGVQGYGVLCVAVAVVLYNSLRWQARIKFRDYFINHQEEIKDYANLKKHLMSQGLSMPEYIWEKQKYMYGIYRKLGLTHKDMIEAHAIIDVAQITKAHKPDYIPMWNLKMTQKGRARYSW
jgi:GrpB-like predicted nucleotidyltransferase (UPF0157 family)